jgi:hypothetical protein
MHIDGELVRIFVTLGILFAVGIPAITRTVWAPTELKCEPVPPNSIDARQTAFFDSHDKKLAEIGFFPFSTFRVTNLQGTNLNRAYMSSTDPARCLLTLISIKGSFTNCLEIVTRFSDGTRLSTKNTELSTVLAVLPNRIVQQFPGISDPIELKRRHDVKAATLQDRMPEFRPQSTYFADLNQYHVQYCQYQVSKNLFHFDAATGLYRATYLTGLRGVYNFLNPLADNFTVRRLLLGMLLGAAPPIIVATQHPHILAWLATATADYSFWLGNLILPAACTFSGVAIGSIFTKKNFIWAILLAYLPARLFSTGLSFGYAIYMAFVADFAARFLNSRRKLV